MARPPKSDDEGHVVYPVFFQIASEDSAVLRSSRSCRVSALGKPDWFVQSMYSGIERGECIWEDSANQCNQCPVKESTDMDEIVCLIVDVEDPQARPPRLSECLARGTSHSSGESDGGQAPHTSKRWLKEGLQI